MGGKKNLIKKIHNLDSYNDQRARDLLLKAGSMKFSSRNRFIISLAGLEDIPLRNIIFVATAGKEFVNEELEDLIKMLRSLDARSDMAPVLIFAIGMKQGWKQYNDIPNFFEKKYRFFLHMGSICYDAVAYLACRSVLNFPKAQEEAKVFKKRSTLVTRPWDARWFPSVYRPNRFLEEGPSEFHQYATTISEAHKRATSLDGLDFSLTLE